MGRSDKTKEGADKKSISSSSDSLEDDDEDENTDEDEEMEAEGRAETPDLYRNSSLGMYAGVSIVS
jgi:E3 ubiquitin-protein ligase HUWE1